MRLLTIAIGFSVCIMSPVRQEHSAEGCHAEFVLGCKYPYVDGLIDVVLPPLVTTWDGDIRDIEKAISNIRRDHGTDVSRLAVSRDGRSLLLSATHDDGTNDVKGVWLFPDWQCAEECRYFDGYRAGVFLSNRFVELYRTNVDRVLVDGRDASVSVPVPQIGRLMLADNGRWARITPEGDLYVGRVDANQLGPQSRVDPGGKVETALWVHGGSVLTIGMRDERVITVVAPGFEIVQRVRGQLRDRTLSDNMFVCYIERPGASQTSRGVYVDSVAIVAADGTFEMHPTEQILPIGCYNISPSGKFALCITSEDRRFVARMPGTGVGKAMPIIADGGVALGWLCARAPAQ